MSKLTISRRYDTKNYTQSERDELIIHLINKTQPQRRVFLGKTEGFKDADDKKFNEKMLKAYKKGALIFYHGKTKREIILYKFNKATGKKDLAVKTGVFEDVPKPHLVRQMYFFN